MNTGTFTCLRCKRRTRQDGAWHRGWASTFDPEGFMCPSCYKGLIEVRWKSERLRKAALAKYMKAAKRGGGKS